MFVGASDSITVVISSSEPLDLANDNPRLVISGMASYTKFASQYMFNETHYEYTATSPVITGIASESIISFDILNIRDTALNQIADITNFDSGIEVDLDAPVVGILSLYNRDADTSPETAKEWIKDGDRVAGLVYSNEKLLFTPDPLSPTFGITGLTLTDAQRVFCCESVYGEGFTYEFGTQVDIFLAMEEGVDGEVQITVDGISDILGNTAEPISVVHDKLVIDNETPSLYITEITSSNSVSDDMCTDGDTVTVRVRSTELVRLTDDGWSTSMRVRFASTYYNVCNEPSAACGEFISPFYYYEVIVPCPSSEGSFSVLVNRGYDLAGNVQSLTVASSGIVGDHTIPVVSYSSTDSSNPNSLRARLGDSLSIYFQSSESLSSLSFHFNGQVKPISSSTQHNSTSFRYSATFDCPPGDGVFAARVESPTDQVGLVGLPSESNIEVIVDNTAPTLSFTGASVNGVADKTRCKSGDTIAVSFSSVEEVDDSLSNAPTLGLSHEGSIRGRLTSTGEADGLFLYGISLSCPVISGALLVDVSGPMDTAGNVGMAINDLSIGITADNVSPIVSVSSAASSNSLSTSRCSAGHTVTIVMEANEDVTISTATVNGVSVTFQSCVEQTPTSFTCRATMNCPNAGDGSLSLSITQMNDLVGNTATFNGAVGVSFDNTQPLITISDVSSVGGSDRIQPGGALSLTFTASELLSPNTESDLLIYTQTNNEGVTSDWSLRSLSSFSVNEAERRYDITFSSNSGDEGALTVKIEGAKDRVGLSLASPVESATSIIVDGTGARIDIEQVTSSNLNPLFWIEGDQISVVFSSDEQLQQVDEAGSFGFLYVLLGSSKETGPYPFLSFGTGLYRAIATSVPAGEGLVAVRIQGVEDQAGVKSAPVAQVTTIKADRTAPTITLSSITSSNYDGEARAVVGDSISLVAVSSEPLRSDPLIRLSVDNGSPLTVPLTVGSDNVTYSGSAVLGVSTRLGTIITLVDNLFDLAGNTNDIDPIVSSIEVVDVSPSQSLISCNVSQVNPGDTVFCSVDIFDANGSPLSTPTFSSLFYPAIVSSSDADGITHKEIDNSDPEQSKYSFVVHIPSYAPVEPSFSISAFSLSPDAAFVSISFFLPEKPIGLEASSILDISATVSWNRLPSVDYYLVKYRVLSDSRPLEVELFSDDIFLSLSDLLPNVEVRFTVTAKNVIGFGEASDSFTFKTKASAPRLVSCVANDPDDGDAVYGNGDTLTITFSESTNAGGTGGGALSSPMNKMSVDSLFNFSTPIGQDYTAVWDASNTTCTITVVDATGASEDVNPGSLHITVVGRGDRALLNSAGTSVLIGGSVSVSGDFGKLHGNLIIVSQAPVSTLEDTVVNVPVSLSDTLSSLGTHFTLTLTVADDSGTLRSSVGSGHAASSIVLSGLPSQIKTGIQALSFELFRDWNGATGLSLSLSEGASVGGDVLDTAFQAYTVVAVKDSPQIDGPTQHAAVFGVPTPIRIGLTDPDQSDSSSTVVTHSLDLLVVCGQIYFSKVNSDVIYSPSTPNSGSSVQETVRSPNFQLKGTAKSISIALSSLLYLSSPVGAKNGASCTADAVAVSVTEVDDNSSGEEPLSAFAFMPITVSCRSDTPTAIVTGGQLQSDLLSVVFSLSLSSELHKVSTSSSTKCPIRPANGAAPDVVFGKGHMCVMDSPISLRLLLGSGAQLSVGDSVELYTDAGTTSTAPAILRRCAGSQASSGSTTVEAPSTPLPFSLSLQGPSSVSICAGEYLSLQYSVSGTGGRPVSMTWSSPTSGLSSELEKEGTLVRLPHDSISSRSLSTVELTATASNFLGQETNATAVVSVSSSLTPSVEILGPRSIEAIVRRKALILEARVSSPCATQADDLKLVWDVVEVVGDNDVTETLFSATGAMATIPAGTLTVGKTYSARVTASFANQRVSTASVTVVGVAAPQDKLKALIVGGDQRSAPFSGQLSLDATVSGIPEGSSAQDLSFVWKCTALGGVPCVRQDTKERFTFQDTASFKLESSLFAVGTYTFTVTVTLDTQTASSSQLVTFIGSQAPAAGMEVTHPSTAPVLLTNSKLVIRYAFPDLISEEQLSFQWELPSGVVTTGIDLTSSTLVVNSGRVADFWSAGDTFSVLLWVSTPLGYRSVARQFFSVAHRPVVGSLSISPSTGTAVTTAFTISVSDFDSAHLPLTYRFFWVHPVTLARTYITRTGFALPYTTAVLPAGDPDASFALTVGVSVVDTIGSSHSSTSSIQVRSVSSGSNLGATVTNALNNADVDQDHSKALVTLITVASEMDDTDSNTSDSILSAIVRLLKDSPRQLILDALLSAIFGSSRLTKKAVEHAVEILRDEWKVNQGEDLGSYEEDEVITRVSTTMTCYRKLLDAVILLFSSSQISSSSLNFEQLSTPHASKHSIEFSPLASSSDLPSISNNSQLINLLESHLVELAPVVLSDGSNSYSAGVQGDDTRIAISRFEETALPVANSLFSFGLHEVSYSVQSVGTETNSPVDVAAVYLSTNVLEDRPSSLSSSLNVVLVSPLITLSSIRSDASISTSFGFSIVDASLPAAVSELCGEEPDVCTLTCFRWDSDENSETAYEWISEGVTTDTSRAGYVTCSGASVGTYTVFASRPRPTSESSASPFLAIGASIAGVAFIIAIIVYLFWWRKKSKDDVPLEQKEGDVSSSMWNLKPKRHNYEASFEGGADGARKQHELEMHALQNNQNGAVHVDGDAGGIGVNARGIRDRRVVSDVVHQQKVNRDRRVFSDNPHGVSHNGDERKGRGSGVLLPSQQQNHHNGTRGPQHQKVGRLPPPPSSSSSKPRKKSVPSVIDGPRVDENDVRPTSRDGVDLSHIFGFSPDNNRKHPPPPSDSEGYADDVDLDDIKVDDDRSMNDSSSHRNRTVSGSSAPRPPPTPEEPSGIKRPHPPPPDTPQSSQFQPPAPPTPIQYLHNTPKPPPSDEMNPAPPPPPPPGEADFLPPPLGEDDADYYMEEGDQADPSLNANPLFRGSH